MFKLWVPKMASSMTRTSPHCVHWSHPCLAYGTLDFLAETASSDTLLARWRLICQLQKYLQMTYLAGDLTVYWVMLALWNKSPEAWARECLLFALYLWFRIRNKEVAEEKERKTNLMTCYREIALKCSQRNTNLCHQNNFQMFSLQGFWRFLENYHNLMTLLPLERAAVIVIN